MSSVLESAFYLSQNMMDVVQLLVRFMAIDNVCFMDHFCLSDVYVQYVSSFVMIAFRMHVYTFAEMLLLFLLLETFFSSRLCIHYGVFAKVIKMYLTLLVFLNALAWYQLYFLLT